MKDFLGYSLVIAGVGSIVVALCAGMFYGASLPVLGGGGLIAVVIGAAILNEK